MDKTPDSNCSCCGTQLESKNIIHTCTICGKKTCKDCISYDICDKCVKILPDNNYNKLKSIVYFIWACTLLLIPFVILLIYTSIKSTFDGLFILFALLLIVDALILSKLFKYYNIFSRQVIEDAKKSLGIGSPNYSTTHSSSGKEIRTKVGFDDQNRTTYKKVQPNERNEDQNNETYKRSISKK